MVHLICKNDEALLLASPLWMLVHCVMSHSRPPDLKSSLNVSLPFVWITGPLKGIQLDHILYTGQLILEGNFGAF